MQYRFNKSGENERIFEENLSAQSPALCIGSTSKDGIKASYCTSTLKTEHRNPYHLKPVLKQTYIRTSHRPISDTPLNALLHLHSCPINLIVSQGSYTLMGGISHLEGGFTLRCLQRLSLPDLATLPWHWLPTDAPVVRPPRSSRTKGSSSQISYARAG